MVVIHSLSNKPLKIACFILSFVCVLACKAQSPILPLKNPGEYQDNAYYKDMDNELDKYVGTWLYQNGTTSLTVQLIKKEQIFNGEWYEDVLIGEYKYVENGVEILNFLPRLSDINVNDEQHYISFFSFVKKLYYPSCDECLVSEQRVLMDFSNPAPDRKVLNNNMVLRHIIENGVHKLQMHLDAGGGAIILAENAPSETRVPYGSYTLIKQ